MDDYRGRPVDPAAMLDLADFTTRERSLELATAGCPGVYTKIAKEVLEGAEFTQSIMLFQAAVSRVRGLHEGILREIQASNPHAVLPLTRAFAEVITIVMYTLRHPVYVATLLGADFRRKSFEAMFAALRDDVEGMKRVYSELSDYTHFGPLAVYNVQRILDEDARTVTWTDAPHWRNEDHFKIACAQTRELALAAQHYLSDFGAMLRTPAPPVEGGSTAAPSADL